MHLEFKSYEWHIGRKGNRRNINHNNIFTTYNADTSYIMFCCLVVFIFETMHVEM